MTHDDVLNNINDLADKAEREGLNIIKYSNTFAETEKMFNYRNTGFLMLALSSKIRELLKAAEGDDIKNPFM